MTEDETEKSPTNGSPTTFTDEGLVHTSAINISRKKESSNGEDTEQYSLLNDNNLHCSVYRRSVIYKNMQLPGEKFEEWFDAGNFRISLSKYRILILGNRSFVCSVPLLMIETIEVREASFVMVCRDGRNIHVPINRKETLYLWTKRMMKTSQVRQISEIFAFDFYAALKGNKLPPWLQRSIPLRPALYRLHDEFRHLQLDQRYRISSANVNFKICSTYPQHLIVPSGLSDEELAEHCSARSANRIPTLSWAYKNRVLLRASQPQTPGWNVFRYNENDLKIIERYREAELDSSTTFLYMDLRTYSAAFANFAKGGGYETGDAYKGNTQFMNMPNIHNVRQCFMSFRANINNDDSQYLYLQNLQTTNWLQNLLQIFKASEEVLNTMEKGQSVLVHCTDGWDRTSQVVALSMLVGDSYYRSFEGFECLIQRQWVDYGHKFGDRSSILNDCANEVCPIFLQFLDCVYQLFIRNPSAFEFNRRYLLKLSQHIYSGLFGTFLFNSLKDAAEHGCAQLQLANGALQPIEQKTFSVWDYLGRHNVEFINPLYDPSSESRRLIVPKTMKDLDVWREAYYCSPTQELLNNMEFDESHEEVDGPSTSLRGTSGRSAGTSESKAAGSGSQSSIHNFSELSLPSSHSATKLETLANDTLPSQTIRSAPAKTSDPLTSRVEVISLRDGSSTIMANQISTSLHNDVLSEDSSSTALGQPSNNALFSSQNSNGSTKSTISDTHRLRTSSESSKNLSKRASTSMISSALEFTNEASKDLDDDGLSRIPIPVEDQMVQLFLKMKSRCQQTSSIPNGNVQLRDPCPPAMFTDKLFTPIMPHVPSPPNASVYYTPTSALVNNKQYCGMFASTSTASGVIESSVGSYSQRRIGNEAMDSCGMYEFVDAETASLSQSLGMHFPMDLSSGSRSSSQNPRHSSASSNGRNEEDDPPFIISTNDSVVPNGALERGALFRSSAASLQGIRSNGISSPGRMDLNGSSKGSSVKPSPAKILNNGNLSGSANSLDESIRAKGQTVAG